MNKERLDRLLQAHGLVASREEARRLIMAGQVLVNGQSVDKPGTLVPVSSEVSVKERSPYVSRGGVKLQAALFSFNVSVVGLIAADIGASTGGFTDCLLKHGAARVYAIDVGYGQLAWSLRQDPRVVVVERTNVRYLESLPEPVDLATVDVSFISLKLVLPAIVGLMKPDGRVIALIKPQFEAGRELVGRKGVVRSRDVHRVVLQDLLTWMTQRSLRLQGLMPSPLRGPAGNVEFLCYLSQGSSALSQPLAQVIETCLAQLGGGDPP